MSEMSLSEYSAEIKALIDAGAVDAAIPMAQHLLRQYPKYIHGYRLLAEAAQKKGEYREAADLFRRVLSADPEDLAARTGLALVYSEEGILDEAIWQMMRAFELAPGNGEVRQNLRHLFEQRDGRAPGRLKLNSAALARVYLRDGWYERAIDELSAQLDSESDRVDLRVALAESLWRAGRRREAVETAHEILDELPFCLKANLILGQFYAEESNIDSAWDHLQVAQALDPENQVAQQLFGSASYLPPHQTMIRPPDKTAGAFQLAGDEDLPQWLRALSLAQEPEQEEWEALVTADWRDQLRAATEEALDQWQPDWRMELRRATEQAYPAPIEEEVAEPVAPAAGPEEAVADWRATLRAATNEALGEREAPAPAAPSEAGPPAWVTLLRGETRPTDILTPPVAPPEAAEVSAAPPAPGLEEAPVPVTDEVQLAPVEVEDRSVEPPDWRTALAQATHAALEQAEAVEAAPEEEPPPPAPLRVGGGSLPPTPVEPEPAVAELPGTVEAVGEEIVEGPPEPAAAEVTTAPALDDLMELVEREPDNLEARLLLADRLREAGQEHTALALYQAIFEAAALDDPLTERLVAWTEGGDAGPKVHQLLGDIYRRHRRLREAVDQYRAAINKM